MPQRRVEPDVLSPVLHHDDTLDRRQLVRRGVALGIGASALNGLRISPALAQSGTPVAKPSKPVTLTIIDVAGQTQLTQPMIDDYVKNNSDWVSKVTYTKATAPELPAKIKAQQNAGRTDISMVMTGSDGLSSGIEQDLWLKLLPDFGADFPNLSERLISPGAQDLAQGFGINVVFGNYGPTFTYNPKKVDSPPTDIQGILDWAKANDKQLMYARPANSGPGRSLLQSLPYLLGDKDPKDPENGWEKTWAYLKELGKYIEYYPSGTSATMQELGQGSRAMVASTMGWDMNPRILGTVPKDFKAIVFKGSPILADTQYITVPKGLDKDKTAAVVNLLTWMLKPDQQAKAYDNAYFYPGPSIKDVTLDMAPKDDQDAVKSVQRPEFDELIKTAKVELPLDAVSLVKAFDIWDKQIGAGNVQQ